MSKYLSVFLIIGFAFVLSGCDLTENVNYKEYEMQGGAIDKTLRGSLGPANENGEYSLTTSDGQKLLHDGGATLEGWVGRDIQVTGQYSGTTLYVDQISPVIQ
jgi:hypothetical protein